MRLSPLGLFALLALSACTPFEGQTPREGRPFEAADLDAGTLRFMHWNINTTGAPGENQYIAMMDVVGRMQPDVLALNEVEDDEDGTFTETFAAEAGYDFVVTSDHVGFGNDRNVIMSRYPLTGYGAWLSDDVGEEHHQGWDSPSLSGDSDAKDLTRAITAARVEAPGGTIGVVSLHWKSGGASDNKTEFRRAVESVRTLQALDEFGDVDNVIVSGDLNVDVNDRDPTPTEFFAEPSGFPARYVLGDDLREMMETVGIPNNPHGNLVDYGLTMHPALQADGFNGTRPESGRVLDYVYTDGMVATDSEVYNSIFDDTSSGITKAGTPLDALACAQTSDHLPVIVDFAIDGNVGPTVLGANDLVAGDLLVTELMANPDNCSDSSGEWVEVVNASGFAVQLEGVVVEDASGNGGTLGDLTIAIGGRVVLANSADACDVVVDAVYSSMTLNNSGDDVKVIANGSIIDSVSYASSGAQAGLSWRVDDNGAWCAGVPSAGTANAECGTEPEPEPTPVPDPGELAVADLIVGDLAITEIMANPENCSDSSGEWIEIENLSGSDIQLDGLVVADLTGNSGTLGAHVLAAGGRAIVARSSSACDVTIDGVYGSSVSWNNGGDEAFLFAAGTIIDSVVYGAAGGTSGASWSVDSTGAWCSGPATAGGVNPTCP